MRHEFECESPADAEERAAAAIRRGIASFTKAEGPPQDELAESILAEFIVDELVEDGFLPSQPRRRGPFQGV
ncbi:hypothetical protein [Alloactinosynnema sp. L-07]|uniref:hypothetical protein n=1 Tax=Alloactinosynnema sp. L-07 TaxID=1653480 RepID=UPI00065EF7AB|nr:hypothetical protein [Alloactinosynnema sp. L-07]CRK56929.1 hypothetical protein [Alloactinosynnema sp. L-07]